MKQVNVQFKDRTEKDHTADDRKNMNNRDHRNNNVNVTDYKNENDMDILNYLSDIGCKELHMATDESTGLKAVIAIYNTDLGPALGGCRCIEYPSTLAAIKDAVRLAQGMTYKAAISNLPLGGGKMVVLKPAKIQDRVAFFKAIGRAVEALNGRYITAVDSGTSVEDMDIVASTTSHVVATTHGHLSIADPSILTAMGVVRAIQAAVKHQLKKDTLEGVHIAIQGLGHAGYAMAKDLHELGARLTVYDIRKDLQERAAREFNASIADNFDQLITLDCDVFSPCALGGILNDETIPKLKARIVAGCANNQLAETRHGQKLSELGILYAPDYVINAGGLIHVAADLNHITEQEARDKINHIYDTLLEIFQLADKESRPTNEIADQLAIAKLKAGKKV